MNAGTNPGRPWYAGAAAALAAGVLAGPASPALASPAPGATGQAQQPPAQVAQPPTADRIAIEPVEVEGSGCQKGTVTVTLSPDRQAFTVKYSDFIALVGGPDGPVSSERSCDLDVSVAIAGGASFAITNVDYRGYAYLEPGVSATHTAEYQTAGQPKTTTQTFTGFYDDNWKINDVVPSARVAFTACVPTHVVRIRTTLRITAPAGSPVSMITMDSTDSSMSSTYRLTWGVC